MSPENEGRLIQAVEHVADKMAGAVRWKELLMIAFPFAVGVLAICFTINTTLMDAHKEHPHEGAVHIKRYDIDMSRLRTDVAAMNIKIDKILEIVYAGKSNGNGNG